MESLAVLTKSWKEQNLILPIWMDGQHLKVVNQLKLPLQEEIIEVQSVGQLADIIRTMTLRGSGAIGISGAYGILLAAYLSKGSKEAIREAGQLLKSTRPTAVNLMKTVDELLAHAEKLPSNEVVAGMEEKVVEILIKQLDFEHALGAYGAELIEDGDTILTHCHSGALAGSGYGGRALSVIRTAWEQGKKIHVFTSETRPYLQGARITAYELQKFGIPHTLITDGMSGYLMELGQIQKVVVGSDRVAANGDLLNKVGTYMHALAANDNGIPFYTATSSHTVDFTLKEGMNIGVEYRDSEEVTHLNGQRITLAETNAVYPSFDVTPNHLINGIITEKGVIVPEYKKNLMTLNEYEAEETITERN